MSTDPVWILYVSRDKRDKRRFDAGSAVCMRIIEEKGLQNKVAIQDIQVMKQRNVSLPSFLEGTPTLVHRVEYTSYTGSDVVFKLFEGMAPNHFRPPPGQQAQETTRPVVAPQPSAPPRNIERELPHPKRNAAPKQLSPPGGDDDDNDDHEAIGGGFGDLVERRPDDDGMDSKRVTENDVQALIQQRQALDNSLTK